MRVCAFCFLDLCAEMSAAVVVQVAVDDRDACVMVRVGRMLRMRVLKATLLDSEVASRASGVPLIFFFFASYSSHSPTLPLSLCACARTGARSDLYDSFSIEGKGLSSDT